MDKQRKEIVKLIDTNEQYSVIKKETSLDIKGIIDFEVILLIIALFIYFIFHYGYTTLQVANTPIYSYYIIVALFIIPLAIFTLRYSICIDKTNQHRFMQTKYRLLGKLTLIHNDISLDQCEMLSLVRLNKLATYLEGRSIRRRFNIYNKYVIYIIRDDASYDRIVGFNNYWEAKRILDVLSSILRCKVSDTTEDEYKDEDDYISSYIRYKNLVKNVKEGVQ